MGWTGIPGSLWPAGEEASQLQAHFFPHAMFLKLYVWNIGTHGAHREQGCSVLYMTSIRHAVLFPRSASAFHTHSMFGFPHGFWRLVF